MFDEHDEHEQRGTSAQPRRASTAPLLKQLARVTAPGSNYKMRSKADIMQERITELFVMRRAKMLNQRLKSIPLSEANKWTIAGEEHALRKELMAGHEPNKCDPFNGRTILHEACSGGHYPIVRMLVLEFGVDVNVPTVMGRSTPLHLAAEKGFRQIASLLLGHGGNATLRDEQGCTPLHVVTKFSLVKVLYKSAAVDFTLRDIHGRTPLERYLAAVPGEQVDHAMVEFMRQREDERMVEATREKLRSMQSEKREQLRATALVTDATRSSASKPRAATAIQATP